MLVNAGLFPERAAKNIRFFNLRRIPSLGHFINALVARHDLLCRPVLISLALHRPVRVLKGIAHGVNMRGRPRVMMRVVPSPFWLLPKL